MFGKPKNLSAFDPTLEENLFQDKEWQGLACWYLKKELENVSLLKQAITNKDFEQIINLADQIYGHGGSFGFARISMFGKKIEVAATIKDTVLLTCLVSSLETYLEYLLRTTSPY